ncbi:MAG: hypothetical protein JW818_12140 [Pirellulales bacterium]|nr:hypothetical protein [Pirellulales bacterium]
MPLDDAMQDENHTNQAEPPEAQSPTDPPGEFLEVPRLSILHLLLWTAVTAVLLGGMIAVGQATVPPITFGFHEVLVAINGAACLTGTGIILVTKCRSSGRFHFGHFFLILQGLFWLGIAWSIYAPEVAVEHHPQDQYSKFPWTYGVTFLILMTGLLVLMIFLAQYPRIGWPLIGLLFLATCIVCIAKAYSSPFNPVSWVPMVAVLLILTMELGVAIWLIRASQKLRADWLHWLGLATFLFYPVVYAIFTACMLVGWIR